MSDIALESLVTGIVLKIEKQVGQPVTKGEAVLIVESMKMEIPVEATHDGTVARIDVAEGDAVTEGQVLGLLRGA